MQKLRASGFGNFYTNHFCLDSGIRIGGFLKPPRALVESDESRTTARGFDVLAIAELTKEVLLASISSLAADTSVTDNPQCEKQESEPRQTSIFASDCFSPKLSRKEFLELFLVSMFQSVEHPMDDLIGRDCIELCIVVWQPRGKSFEPIIPFVPNMLNWHSVYHLVNGSFTLDQSRRISRKGPKSDSCK